MTLTSEQSAGVRETLDKFCAAYRRKDLKAILSLFSPNVRGFGSGPDEFFSDRKEYASFVERDLLQATSISIEFPGATISGDGRVAWVTSGCTCTFALAGGGKQAMKGRMTLVLKNSGSRWLIEQYHFAMPNTGQAPGQAFSGA